MSEANVEAVRRIYAASDWTGAWADVHNEPRELFDLGERVVVHVHGRFRLTETSEPFESDCGHVWTIGEEGKARSCESVDLEQALALTRGS